MAYGRKGAAATFAHEVKGRSRKVEGSWEHVRRGRGEKVCLVTGASSGVGRVTTRRAVTR
jgi:hypothetical protein